MGAIVNIDVLKFREYKANDSAIIIGIPVLAIECEVAKPIDNSLDAYEEAVLKLLEMGQTVRGIAKILNATEALIIHVLNNLKEKMYVEKPIGSPWLLCPEGKKVLRGDPIPERKSSDSKFGFMFINAIRKDVIPFFYLGDINAVDTFKGKEVPLKLILDKNEEATFELVNPRRSQLSEAYSIYLKKEKRFIRKGNHIEAENDGEDSSEEWESFDEEQELGEEEKLTMESDHADILLDRNLLVRPLECEPKKYYLGVRILLDAREVCGYKVDDPFDFLGKEDRYFQDQIVWLEGNNRVSLGKSLFSQYMEKEIRKIGAAVNIDERSYDVFLTTKMPLLKTQKDKYLKIYQDMKRIYALIQREESLLEKENIVSNISRSVLESLLNMFFKDVSKTQLGNIRQNIENDLIYSNYGGYLKTISTNTSLTITPSHSGWGKKRVLGAAKRLDFSRGNSFVEKFINIVFLNYYSGSIKTQKLLGNSDVQKLYDTIYNLSDIRNKVSHDTDDPFENKDYKFFITNYCDVVNELLAALEED